MSNPFAARAAAFGVQTNKTIVLDEDFDLPPPPPGYTQAAVAPPIKVQQPQSSSSSASSTPSQQSTPATVNLSSVSPNFKPPPGSTGPPPAGGSKTAAQTTTSAPTATAAAAAKPAVVTAAAAKVSPQPATVSPVLKSTVSTSAAVKPVPLTSSTTSSPPTNAAVKTTITAGSNVVNGAERGAFGALYTAKPAASGTSAAKPAATSSSSVNTSNAALMNKLNALNVSSEAPPPPPADDLPPPPPPSGPDNGAAALANALRLGGTGGQGMLRPVGGVNTSGGTAGVNSKIFGAATIAAGSKSAALALGSNNTPITSPASTSASVFADMADTSHLPRCSECGLAIRGSVLELADGRTLHSECLVCYTCKLPVTDGIMQIGDKTYHEHCMKCAACGISVANAPFATHPTTGAFFCATHAQQARPNVGPQASSTSNVSNKKCGGCNESIDPTNPSEPLIAASGDIVFHSRCMKCDKCNIQLDPTSKVYAINGGKFLCEKDYLTAHGKNCIGCHTSIKDGNIMSIDTGNNNELNYHSACFNCAKCGKGLNGQNFFLNPKGEGLVCEKCNG
jgi:hypothetical protein